eukprot:CAMPEP_0177665546 /NCGR_PEP_ID=MMETSP0447-20121125/21108_1 /TAXON_ID=0 /ORGANISM="Stygamoeba regulata, Strain BSH-02190019" /LENGTH=222 /DNA_ID=CAMNT_0019171639 /DNA_START=52 /DNA_END=720 /DNA_ORIENTATION=-
MAAAAAKPILLGDVVPDFEAETTAGPIKFHEWIGDKWAILFSHPADYTPVCTTELGTASRLEPEFTKRGVKLIALSVDSLESHKGWVKDINETQDTELTFPIIADPERTVAGLYSMLSPNAADTMAGKLTVRSVFIIDSKKQCRLTLTYPAATGRNFYELLRVIDALHLTDNYKVATPANWKHQDPVVVLPNISTEDAKVQFPKGVTEVKPYLRMTPQPNLD